MIKQIIKNSLSGLVVGTSMLIPGLSGGTMAIIIGIYDKLIHSVSSLSKLKEIKKSILFLLQFAAGAGLGIIAFSRIIDAALLKFELPMMFLFIGIILGSIPTLFKKANVGKPKLTDIIFVLIGLAFCVLTTLIPEELIDFKGGFSLSNILIIFVAGFVIAVALVLPGISASHMLLILGIYEITLNAVENMNFAFLIPLVLSVGIGTLATTSIIEKALNSHPKATYLIIIGFVLASIADIFPGVPEGIDLPICVITFLGGMALIMVISMQATEDA